MFPVLLCRESDLAKQSRHCRAARFAIGRWQLLPQIRANKVKRLLSRGQSLDQLIELTFGSSFHGDLLSPSSNPMNHHLG
jgi:hypothetical protein